MTSVLLFCAGSLFGAHCLVCELIWTLLFDVFTNNLAGSPSIQVTLQLSYEYLRLYTNAFAFQAAISQSLASKVNGNDHTQREHLRSTFNNVASLQDARFIYESVDAAKAYLTILVDRVDPEKHLHFMPLRFYL